MVAPSTTVQRRAPALRKAKLDPPVAWLTPQPLWEVIPRSELAARRGQPVLLRFASDNFMQELIDLLIQGRALELRSLVAQPETWRDRPLLTGLDEAGRDRPGNLKLYQPAHGRFYLVAGALACRMPGLPDREIDTGQEESAFYVLRRLEGNVEYGWSTGGGGWVPLADPANSLVPEEERLPLFPISFADRASKRRILAGMIPAGSQEAAPQPDRLPANTVPIADDPRPILFEQQVTVPLAGVREWYSDHSNPGQALAAERRPVEHALAFALLDLMTALRDHVKLLYDDIVGSGIREDTNRYGAAKGLADLIAAAANILPVLKAIDKPQARGYLEEMQAEGDVDDAPGLASAWKFDTQVPALSGWVALNSSEYAMMQIQRNFVGALTTPYKPPADQYPALPQSDPRGTQTRVIRLVYERPRCGYLTISQRTRAFTLAPFFDPDAPVRPLRITMPVDTTTEGLKKYDKGVSILISKELRNQMDRVKGLKELMDGDVNSPGTIDFGMICSFSIPIITICALILLMIIVSLLNIIFWWLPFFKICLPIPLVKPSE